MRNYNMLLLEVTQQKDDAPEMKEVIADYKKVLNTCKLAKFKSDTTNAKFYGGFFNCNLEEKPTFAQWVEIYTTLLNDDTFVNNLCMFIAMWQPKDTLGMFQPIVNQLESELREDSAKKVRLLSDAKALFTFMNTKFDSIGNTIKAQVNDLEVFKFLSILNSVLTNFELYFNKQIQREVQTDVNPDDISIVVHHGPMDESFEPDVQEILDLLENADSWTTNYINEHTFLIDENVINKAVEAKKVAKVKAQKADRAFNEFVMKKVRELRTNRRNRRHSEMVGESLRINTYLKRILKAGGLSIINPAIGVISFCVDTLIDKKTAAKDRKILINQIQDELEIMDEKISIADRNGDEKGKIELMRGKQKLQREYERIVRMKYDPDRHR